MSLLLTFMELDKLNESTNKHKKSKSTCTWAFIGKAGFWNRRLGCDDTITISRPMETSAKSEAEALNNIKYRIRQNNNLPKDTALYLFDYELLNKTEFDNASKPTAERPFCKKCERALTDSGYCPVCDIGEEDLDEGIFDALPDKNSWVMMSPVVNKYSNDPVSVNNVNQVTNTSDSAMSSQNQAQQQVTIQTPSNKNIVTIVYDNTAHKLRARADDGIHGEANVAFPNTLRVHSGLQYEVEKLIWNGKNYRVSGEITPIINSGVTKTLNINEKINKENFKMNFTSVFEELNNLYEEVAAETEDTDDAELDIEVAEDSEADVAETANKTEESNDTEAEEPKQVILECSKCGSIILKNESDIKFDEATDLVDIEVPCQYCEETEGYKLIGMVAVYETPEALEEDFIFDKNNKIDKNLLNAQNTKFIDPEQAKKGDLVVGALITAHSSEPKYFPRVAKVLEVKPKNEQGIGIKLKMLTSLFSNVSTGVTNMHLNSEAGDKLILYTKKISKAASTEES